MNIAPIALFLVAAGTPVVAAQTPLRTPRRDRDIIALRADSLRQAGRPWHAAELLLEAAERDPDPDASFVVQGAAAELAARRYERARTLLIGRSWLEAYDDGLALAVLGAAEARLGLHEQAATHFAAAHERARGSAAALWAVHAGLAWERLGERDSAAKAFAAARSVGLPTIDPWLRLREARVVRDTARAARLLSDLPQPAARQAPVAWANALLGAGDSLAALDRFTRAGRSLDIGRLALQLGDSARAREALFGLMARAPETDDAAAAVGIALAALPPRAPRERVALARAMKLHGAAADARVQVQMAVQGGDSSAATLVLLGELFAAAGRYREAIQTYQRAERDSLLGPLATYRRARILSRLGDAGATAALSGFAARYPTDSAAPTALFVLGDLLADRAEWSGAARWFGELFARYPTDPRSSQARMRLATDAAGRGMLDSAAALYRAEVAAPGPQRLAARFWLGKIALARGDTATARDLWATLAQDDSVGYYGLRARAAAHLPPLAIAVPAQTATPPAVLRGLAAIDTLVFAGLDSEARAEVRHVLGNPPAELETLLSWSEGLATRGWGPAGVRLAWLAALRSPNDPRVLRAIFPWPNRSAVEAEAREFGIDPLLLVAIVRQESVFDPAALSPAGARGLAQLLPGTAAFTARGLDVSFDKEWITVPDLNLHLGAAHFAALLRRFDGRIEPAVAAYNAGSVPVVRWLDRAGGDDPDRLIELISYPETRGYVRSVLRNRALYRAMYGPPSD